jgi:hypothetical protein
MKTLIYTAFNEAYRPLAEITLLRMRDYARRHGIAFACFSGSLISDMPDGIYWTKFMKAEELLRDFYRIIWLDVDQLITNFDAEIDIPKVAFGFHVSKDWGHDATEPHHFSVCGFAAHRDSLPLIGEVISMASEFAGKPFPEQEPMRRAVNKRIEAAQDLVSCDERALGFINIRERRLFNCVPDAVCPGKVPDPWQPSDFAAHITMLPIEERVKLAQQILSTL